MTTWVKRPASNADVQKEAFQQATFQDFFCKKALAICAMISTKKMVTLRARRRFHTRFSCQERTNTYNSHNKLRKS